MTCRPGKNVVATVLLILLCLVSVRADAQLQKGLLGGWNTSDWDVRPPTGGQDLFESRTGFCAGGYLGGRVTSGFGWRGELLYTRKGAVMRMDFADENGDPAGELEMVHGVDYLEIPLLMTWTIPTGGPVRPVFFLGPALDFELSAKVETRYPGGVDNSFAADKDLKTSNSMDFSLVFGGGIEIDAGGKAVNLQVRYVMGTLDIYRTAKNSTLSVMAGFGI